MEIFSQELIGAIMIGVMLFAIFIGFPISFTLIFLGLVFGYWGFGKLVFYLMTLQFNMIMTESTLVAVPLFIFMALWLNGAGPEVKAEAPNEAPAPFVDLHGLEGLLRKPDPKIVLSLPEDAELIDQLHRLTGKMPKFAQFNPPPAASTEAPPEPQAPVKAETAKEQSAPHANPPAAAATMDLCDLTSGRRRKHAAAE